MSDGVQPGCSATLFVPLSTISGLFRATPTAPGLAGSASPLHPGTERRGLSAAASPEGPPPGVSERGSKSAVALGQ